jgi:hypothetical protein
MKQTRFNSARLLLTIMIAFILVTSPMITTAQLTACLSAHAGSTFKGLGYSSSGAGFKLSLGYEIQKWIEIDFQAQHYWLNALSYNQLNSMALNAKIIPFSTNIKPYLAFAGGIGKLNGGKMYIDGDVRVFIYDTWLLKPQIGLLMDSGWLKDLLVDINVFYESNKFQGYNGKRFFNLYGVNLGLRYRFSL